MSYLMEFTGHDGWTRVVTTGHLDSADTFAEHLAKVIQHLLSSGVRRVLVDNRGVKVSIDACDVAQVARQMVEKGVPALGIRYAVLCTEPVEQSCRFLETTFRNNSLRFRMFPS